MATRLVDTMPRQAKGIFYNPSLQASLFAHRAILLSPRKHHLMSVDLNIADRFRGDFIGLLQELGIPVDLHPLVCEMNDLLDPTDYDGTLLSIKLPFEEEVKEIVSRHKSLDG